MRCNDARLIRPHLSGPPYNCCQVIASPVSSCRQRLKSVVFVREVALRLIPSRNFNDLPLLHSYKAIRSPVGASCP